ncbi:uncharacterized protein BT62DRAFT_76469 [Guyanagaster necrorhizus]|uniref:Uncharacterized protein n=1 Tax=Guyanagaster necrorhizus TaxID=856835 RepID=A0A9P7VUT6_9AGAR|nr:uncharacterized protein BT62DRAFT_76469 [Guyanagaster necrorhizus MCA 3950]KAG7447339.1 hypothetical protein BT62DRAFT_76469 [Guyanagaster necrorhizus MCA 3950]
MLGKFLVSICYVTRSVSSSPYNILTTIYLSLKSSCGTIHRLFRFLTSTDYRLLHSRDLERGPVHLRDHGENHLKMQLLQTCH